MSIGHFALRNQLREATAEMIEWGTGRKSNTNDLMSVENGAENRVATLAAVAVADAADTARWSSLVQGLAAALQAAAT